MVTPAYIRAVRLMIPDVDAIYGASGTEHLFSDEDLEILLEQGSGNAKWAAGLAMIAVGNSEAMIAKVIRNYETETDGSKLQKEWRASGQVLVKLGQDEVKAELDAESEGFFIYAGYDPARHPEGLTHGSYRFPTPTGYNW